MTTSNIQTQIAEVPSPYTHNLASKMEKKLYSFYNYTKNYTK